MRGKFSTLSGVALVALAIAGVATPTMAQAKSKGAGTVTLTADQWQAIQSELAELHQDVNQLKAEQQATQSQAVQAQTQATQAQTQATQAAAAATQAQTAANDAKTVAKTASADAVKPFAGLKDTTISGRMYFNASEITREVNGSKTESDGGFLIKRFYLGVDHKFNNVLSGNITTDVDSVGSTNGSLVGKGLYIKKAYLQAKFSP
ncbi:MAG: porin, partial [Croceibacterium sp.]